MKGANVKSCISFAEKIPWAGTFINVLLFAACVSFVFSCGNGEDTDFTADGGWQSEDGTRIYSLKMTTKCEADGFESDESSTRQVTVGRAFLIIDDESWILGGLTIPVFISNGNIIAGNFYIKTDEMFGDIFVKNLFGEISAEDMYLEIRFRVLDVGCSLSGEGTVLSQ